MFVIVCDSFGVCACVLVTYTVESGPMAAFAFDILATYNLFAAYSS